MTQKAPCWFSLRSSLVIDAVNFTGYPRVPNGEARFSGPDVATVGAATSLGAGVAQALTAPRKKHDLKHDDVGHCASHF